jgi:small subunit ribosomal protein S4e
MAKNHLKRISAPKSWPIQRKENTWITRPSGSHKLDFGLPLNVVFRDLIKSVKTTAELRKILFTKTVLINGKQVKDTSRMVGFLDIISIKETSENYTILINDLGKLEVVLIDAKEATSKLSKVIGKTYLKNRTIQLNFHDGTNLIAKKDEYKVGDSVIVSLADKKIIDHFVLDKNALVYLIDGKHTGHTGIIEKVEKGIIICKVDDLELELNKNQIIVIGKDKSVFSYIGSTPKKADAKKKSEKKE